MNLMRKLGLIVLALMVTLSVAGPIMGQEDAVKHKQTLDIKEASTKGHAFGSPAWGAGLGAGLVIIGAAIGFGRIGAAALESMARQPETAGKVQTAMIIIGALLEGATFFALIICIQLAGKA